MAQINTLLAIRFPKKISSRFMSLIFGYSVQVDKYVLDSEYMTQGHAHDLWWLNIIKEYNPKYLIYHQFYCYLGETDLERMLTDLSESNDNILGIGLYGISARLNACEYNEKIRYMEGTQIYKCKQYKKMLELALNNTKSISDECKTVEATQELDYNFLEAPYAREYNLPSHAMISATEKSYSELL